MISMSTRVQNDKYIAAAFTSLRSVAARLYPLLVILMFTFAYLGVNLPGSNAENNLVSGISSNHNGMAHLQGLDLEEQTTETSTKYVESFLASGAVPYCILTKAPKAAGHQNEPVGPRLLTEFIALCLINIPPPQPLS